MSPDFLDPKQWRRLSDLLDAALDLPPDRLTKYLEETCRDDPEMRSAVEQVLRAAEAPSGILERMPALSLPSTHTHYPEEVPSAPAGTRGPADGQLRIGERIGSFQIREEIGRGGMGVIYLADRVDVFEQRVAIKLMRRGTDTDEVLSRFVQERHILARLEHPQIARLIEAGATESGLPYLAMEYVDGEPITVYCERLDAPLAEVLRLFHQICRAVQFAHERFVVHRDLKPSNILVNRSGEVKLLDFGIAKLLDAPVEARTAAFSRRLTPFYAAPEQWGGEPPTAATDVYSLGVLLYELLAGVVPGRIEEPVPASRRLESIAIAPPPSVASGRPEATPRQSGWRDRLRGDLDNIVLQAMRPAPAERYPSAAALVEDVERFRSGLPVRATRPTVRYRARKFIARHRVAVGAAGLVLASLLIGIASTSWQARIAARERDHARAEAAKAERINQFMLGLFRSVDPNVTKGKAITARELLDEGAARVAGELADQPLVQATLLSTLGNLYRQISSFDRAQEMYERALALRRQHGDAKSAEVGTALADLGSILGERGRYKEALDALHSARAIQSDRLGVHDPEVAATLSKTAAVYQGMGRFGAAESLYMQALDTEERAFGSQDARVADELDRLGNLKYAERRPFEAAPLHERALAIRMRTVGHDNLATATTMENVANAIGETGKVARSESLHVEALGIVRRLYGTDHYLAINMLKNLAGHYLSRAKWERGEVPALEALRVCRLNFGEEHPLTALMEHNAGMFDSYLGRFARAESLILSAQGIWKRTLGADYVIALHSQNSLGEIYLQEGRLGEAERLLIRTLEEKRRKLGDDNYQISFSLLSIGRLRKAQGRDREAEVLFRRALAMSEKVFGVSHFRNAESMAELAGAIYEQGRLQEAAALYERAVRLFDRVLEPGSNLAIDAYVGWGRSLCALGATSRADSVLRIANAARHSNPHQWAARLAETDAALGVCLVRAGRTREGRDLLAASLPILRRDPIAPRSLVRDARQSLLAAR
jgi:serine/threonine protein kinase/tetratricopeptide (TPR) repeat protein